MAAQAKISRLPEHLPVEFRQSDRFIEGVIVEIEQHADRHLILLLGTAMVSFDQSKTILLVHFGVRRHTFEQEKFLLKMKRRANYGTHEQGLDTQPPVQRRDHHPADFPTLGRRMLFHERAVLGAEITVEEYWKRQLSGLMDLLVKDAIFLK